MAKNSFETVEEIKKQLEAEGKLVKQNKSIDEVTGKPILVVTSKDSFVSAINNLEPVIEVKGEVANKCFGVMKSKAKVRKRGKLVQVSSILGGIYLIAFALNPVADAIIIAVFGVGALTNGVAKAMSKNMDKYEAQIISEDDIIFRLKK